MSFGGPSIMFLFGWKEASKTPVFKKTLFLATSTFAGGLARSLFKAHSLRSSKWTQISELHMEVLCVPYSKSFLQGLGPCRDQELDLMRIMHRRSRGPIPSQLQFLTSDKVRSVQHGTNTRWRECPFLVCVCVWGWRLMHACLQVRGQRQGYSPGYCSPCWESS